MSDRKIVGILILVQLVLCLLVVDSFPIALDEPFSIFHAQYPLTEMLAEINQGNNSPLHFIGLHFWIKAFGIGPFGVRSLSIVFSLISILYLYKLGRKFWKKEYAALLVGLFIFSRLNHIVAMEARMYVLFTLFFILILYDFYRLLFEDKKVFLRLAIWNVLLLYTHYLGAIILLMECIVFMIYFSQWNKRKITQVLLTMAVGVLLFIPGIGVFINRANEFTTTGTWVSDVVALDLWTNIVKFFNNSFTLFVTLGLIVVLAVIGRKKKRDSSKLNLWFFIIWFFGTYVIMFLFSLVFQPIFFIKYLQFLTVPLFFILVELVAMYKFKGAKAYLPFLIIIPFITSFNFVPDMNREMDNLVKYVTLKKTENTVIYYCPKHYELSLAYYFDRSLFENYREMEKGMKSNGFYSIYYPTDFLNDPKIERIIYLDLNTQVLNANNGILEALNERHNLVDSKEFKGRFRVFIYAVKE